MSAHIVPVEKAASHTPMVSKRAHFFGPDERATFTAPVDHLYYFDAYIGRHEITVDRGDCAYIIDADGAGATLQCGPTTLISRRLTTVVRGYQPESKHTTIGGMTVLPYINGCSTKQLFAPDRPGDPTLQLLHMPGYTSEQAHHVHATARVVYVLRGRGIAVIGLGAGVVRTELRPGMVCILEPMCPHHFETPDAEGLTVVPLHVFSSTKDERSHPMMLGTHAVDPG